MEHLMFENQRLFLRQDIYSFSLWSKLDAGFLKVICLKFGKALVWQLDVCFPDISAVSNSFIKRVKTKSDAYISHVSMAMTGVFVSTNLKSPKLSQEWKRVNALVKPSVTVTFDEAVLLLFLLFLSLMAIKD